MNKKMLVECDPHETRIAILEEDRLSEIFLERLQHRGVVGNIYQGRVKRVLPGMQAAFVDIGLERDAFLYVSEVTDPLATIAEFEGEETTGEGDESDETSGEPAAGRDSEKEGAAGAERPREAERSIDQLLTVGQELMVQVVKDALSNKGARVTTQITLPGRHLVLLPNEPHIGVSRRIEDEDERQRLRELLEPIRPPGDGLIVRTVGAEGGGEDFENDLSYLMQLWRRIRRRGEQVAAPALMHRDLDLALRVVRDFFSSEFSVLWVDGEETYERIVDFVDQVQPALLSRVKLYRDLGLLERFGINAEIEGALKTKVWLKSGGHIVIHPTEALVAIDVNTGRYVGSHNLEDTVLTTNLEAVREIVRQVRLRNLGGILVIDLIDMEEPEHREQVFQALAEELSKDRAKNKVLNISEFGLVEITRKRTRPSLERLLTQPCPYCRGVGRIKSLATIGLELRRQLLQQRGRFQEREVLLRVHPDVAQALQREERPILEELESALGTQILLQSDSMLHHESFDILDV
ncbi:MAG: Rne/Rng family ribonuclease [bacterium]|nr:Rne/Rng family ribonuclease [bacterium]